MHLLACAYALSRESCTPKHTLRYQPWEREDFLPQETREHTLQVASRTLKCVAEAARPGASERASPCTVGQRTSYAMIQK